MVHAREWSFPRAMAGRNINTWALPLLAHSTQLTLLFPITWKKECLLDTGLQKEVQPWFSPPSVYSTAGGTTPVRPKASGYNPSHVISLSRAVPYLAPHRRAGIPVWASDKKQNRPFNPPHFKTTHIIQEWRNESSTSPA